MYWPRGSWKTWVQPLATSIYPCSIEMLSFPSFMWCENELFPNEEFVQTQWHKKYWNLWEYTSQCRSQKGTALERRRDGVRESSRGGGTSANEVKQRGKQILAQNRENKLVSWVVMCLSEPRVHGHVSIKLNCKNRKRAVFDSQAVGCQPLL